MRVRINPSLCIASGACRMLVPTVFGEDDDGIVVLLKDTPEEADIDAVREAVLACPAAVISVDG
jgi:ferredoxin